MSITLLCLHGWGGSQASFTELREELIDAQIQILTPDLPGFGEQPEPTHPWGVDDYADWVEEYLKDKQYEHLHIVGHSHGGRIAITLAVRGSLPIEHLYLCAAAGIRHPRHLKRIIGLTLSKTGKFFLSIPGLKVFQPLGKKFLYKLVRVHDYERASPIMRQTLIEIAKEDLRPLLPKIDVPTDIFWGRDDGMTPYDPDALIMAKEIQGSTLYSFENTRHRVHRDRAKEIAEVIRKRISM